MKNIRFLAILAIGLFGGLIASLAIADTQLIVPPGALSTQVFGINDRGDVVGNVNDPVSYPYVYASKKGTFTEIEPATGFLNTSVLGNNDAGTLVGSVLSMDELTQSGFIRSKKGTYTIFDHPDAFSATNPRAINNKGLVSGFSDREDGQLVGFIYDSKKATFTDIDNGNALATIVHGINSKGEVVGNSFFDPVDDPCGFGTFVSLGWVRATDGTVNYFRINGEFTRPRGINDSGSVVGFVNDADLVKGFNVQPDGSQCQSITVDSGDLLWVMGFDATFPEGISNSGDIVGTTGDFDGPSLGFIVTPH